MIARTRCSGCPQIRTDLVELLKGHDEREKRIAIGARPTATTTSERAEKKMKKSASLGERAFGLTFHSFSLSSLVEEQSFFLSQLSRQRAASLSLLYFLALTRAHTPTPARALTGKKRARSFSLSFSLSLVLLSSIDCSSRKEKNDGSSHRPALGGQVVSDSSFRMARALHRISIERKKPRNRGRERSREREERQTKKEVCAMASKKKSNKKNSTSTSTSLNLSQHSSRPKNINEIAHQEEVVKALNRSLETANVSLDFLFSFADRQRLFAFSLTFKTSVVQKTKTILSAPAPPLLRPARDRQDLDRARDREAALRVREFDSSCSSSYTFFLPPHLRKQKKHLQKLQQKNSQAPSSSRPASSSSTPPTSAASASSAPRSRPLLRAPWGQVEEARGPRRATLALRTNC